MKVRILKAFRAAGKEYHPPGEVEFDEEFGKRLVAQGFAEEIAEAPNVSSVDFENVSVDFENVGDISDVLPTSAGGEGEQYEIDALVGSPIIITDVAFDKGRSGKLEGKDIAIVQIIRQAGFGRPAVSRRREGSERFLFFDRFRRHVSGGPRERVFCRGATCRPPLAPPFTGKN